MLPHFKRVDAGRAVMLSFVNKWQSSHKPPLSRLYIHACRHANTQKCMQYVAAYMFYAFKGNRFNFV